MATTTRSFNEIAVTVRKACVGAGCDHGMADDIGRAAAWLHRNGAPGVKAALAALEETAPAPALPRTDGSVLVFDNARIALCGAAAIDMLISGAVREARLLNADAPLLAIGLLGARAKQDGLSFRVVADGAAMTVGASVGSLASLSLAPRADVIIAGPQETMDPELDRLPTTVALVDENDWRRCERLAARTYVPATEESRLKGAGGSHTDND